MNRRNLLALATFAPGALLASPARAALASHTAQLLAGGERDGYLLAGLHITLEPSWKTYWKMPGQSGIPPQFDWSGSENIKELTVKYPVPSRFEDASGEVVGYHDEVLFPIVIEPLHAEKPVVLRIVTVFGVCRDICIPARHELTLDFSLAQQDMQVPIWMQRVPEPVTGGTVSSAKAVEQEGGIVLTLQVEGEPQDIFVEQDSGAYFGKPKPGAGTGLWNLPVSNVKSASEIAGKPLTVTVSYAGKAVEQRISLD